MTKMRKITVSVRRDHLESAQEMTGEGITETIRIALRMLVLRKRYPARGTDELLELARQPLSY
jgi:hypothetical protein